MDVATKGLVGAVLLLGCAGRCVAQISLSSAVGLALKNDPKVRAAQANVVKAQAGLSQAYDAFVPSVTASGGIGEGYGAPTGLPVIASVSTQSLVYNFSQRDNVRGAAAAVQAAKLSLRETGDQVSEDVVLTYVHLDNDEQRREALTQEAGFAARLVEIVQQRLDMGQDTDMELLRAQRTAKQLELDLANIENEIEDLSGHLCRMMGVPVTQLVTEKPLPALPAVKDLTVRGGDSFGVQAALENAKSKQELAFGAKRYEMHPQVLWGANFSRLDTGENHFDDYYPDFQGKTKNAVSIYVEVQLPIFDKRRRDEARQDMAEANHALFEAADLRNQFQEGQAKLSRSARELGLRSELSEIDSKIAQKELDAIMLQLGAAAGASDGAQRSPKDEQNARIQERQKFIEWLGAEYDLEQAQVNLMRQTGRLDDWLAAAGVSLER